MRFHLSPTVGLGAFTIAATLGLQSTTLANSFGVDVLINEVDSDTDGSDALEFVELYSSSGATNLDGLVLVFYNGSSDTVYNAFDLDGMSTNASGYFLAGNAGVVPAPDLVFPGNGLQNGADAVALYAGNDTDFPNGNAVTTTNLIDAVVYDTNDGDDAGLLVLLGGCCQLNEDANGNKDFESIQRCPDGAGGALNTASMITALATPGAECSQDAVFANYCVTFPNSFAVSGAVMDHTGSGGIVDNDTVLLCNDVPNSFGIFYFGADTAFNAPFGNGVMCVAAPVFRLPPAGMTNGANQASRALDFLSAGNENQIMSGQTWHFQYWYRDVGQGADFNTSDGLSITFAP